jgi:hypothetical protein
MCRPLAETKTEGSKAFFFEKKKQKTFDESGCGVSGWSEARLAQVFSLESSWRR